MCSQDIVKIERGPFILKHPIPALESTNQICMKTVGNKSQRSNLLFFSCLNYVPDLEVSIALLLLEI